MVQSMWLFKHKFHAGETLSRYKTRLVGNGSSQQLGIDCDETFSLVVKPATIHTVLSLAVSRKWPVHQLDVKKAFLNRDLSETVYMHQPSGFRDSRYPHHVFLLQRSLYGLKQAPHAWFKRFARYGTPKFVRDFKSLANEANESLVKHKALEFKIEHLLRAVDSQDIMSIVQNPTLVETSDLQTELDRMKEKLETCIIKKEKEYVVLWNNLSKNVRNVNLTKFYTIKLIMTCNKRLNGCKLSWDISRVRVRILHVYQIPLILKLEDENVSLEFQVRNYAKENEHLKTTYKNVFNSINVTRAQTKIITDSLQNKLNDTVYENAKLRAQLSDKVSSQKDSTKVVRQPIAFQTERPKSSKTWVPPKVVETNDLSNPVTSHSVPITKESKVVKNDNVISPGMFRINPSKTFTKDNFVPINQARASIWTNPITVSQSHVITKKDVNSDSNGLSSIGVDNTAKTKRPQPRSNTKNDRVPSVSKSSCIKTNEVKVEDHIGIYRFLRFKTKGERRSLALKAKKESSDEESLTFGSEDEEYTMAVKEFKKFFKRRECPKPLKDKNQRAFVRCSWSDSGEEDDEKAKDETCLMAQASNEQTHPWCYEGGGGEEMEVVTVVRLWRWWRGCGGVGGGYRRVEESGVVDRVHRVVGSLFGLAGKIPPEKFSGGGATVAGGGGVAGEERVDQDIQSIRIGELHSLLDKVVSVGAAPGPNSSVHNVNTITNGDGILHSVC
ncbi:retrovirus-related pol polyprotein from transposon TNT 1-94 [Tanacetum coccineum]